MPDKIIRCVKKDTQFLDYINKDFNLSLVQQRQIMED